MHLYLLEVQGYLPGPRDSVALFPRCNTTFRPLITKAPPDKILQLGRHNTRVSRHLPSGLFIYGPSTFNLIRLSFDKKVEELSYIGCQFLPFGTCSTTSRIQLPLVQHPLRVPLVVGTLTYLDLPPLSQK